MWDGFQPSPPPEPEWLLQEMPPRHQVGLGLVGTVGLSQLWAARHLSYVGTRCLLVTANCRGLLKSQHWEWVPQAGPTAGNQTWWGNLLCKGGQSGCSFLLQLLYTSPHDDTVSSEGVGFAFHRDY